MITVLKVLFSIVIIILLLYKGKARFSVRKKYFFLGLCVFFAFFAFTVCKKLPALTDRVTVTALGENGANGRHQEICIENFTIDGKPVNVDRIAEGKWFWAGTYYAWRPEFDPRQPDGTTRTVVLKVPVGCERSVNFMSDEWRGWVEVQTENAETQKIDTSVCATLSLGHSSTGKLLLNQMKEIAVYSFIFLLLSSLLYGILINKNDWVYKSKGKLLPAGIAIVTFLCMLNRVKETSLWADEFLRVSLSMLDIKSCIENCLKMTDATPPLFLIFSSFWYKIVPYGEKWLLLPNIACVCFAIYLLGRIGEKVSGTYCAMLTSIFAACNATIWGYVAYEFSSYAFCFLFTVIAIYSHVNRSLNPDKRLWEFIYTMTLLLLAMSHYFGMLACALFFAFDLILCLKKEISWKTVFNYFPMGIVSFIWLFLVYRVTLQNRASNEIASWFPVPKMIHIKSLLSFLTGSDTFTYCMLLISIAMAGFFIVFFKKNDLSRRYQIFFAVGIVSTVLLLWLYGNYVNNTSTLWESRYFIFLIGPICIIIAQTIMEICNRIFHGKKSATLSVVVSLIVLQLSSMMTADIKGPQQTLKSVADWLYTQSNDVYNQDTLIICTTGIASGWEEYYLSQRGRRDSLKVINQDEICDNMAEQYQRIYVEYSFVMISPELQKFLDQYYVQVSDNFDIQVRVFDRKVE